MNGSVLQADEGWEQQLYLSCCSSWWKSLRNWRLQFFSPLNKLQQRHSLQTKIVSIQPSVWKKKWWNNVSALTQLSAKVNTVLNVTKLDFSADRCDMWTDMYLSSRRLHDWRLLLCSLLSRRELDRSLQSKILNIIITTVYMCNINNNGRHYILPIDGDNK